jgi:hypothetical protein
MHGCQIQRRCKVQPKPDFTRTVKLQRSLGSAYFNGSQPGTDWIGTVRCVGAGARARN